MADTRSSTHTSRGFGASPAVSSRGGEGRRHAGASAPFRGHRSSRPARGGVGRRRRARWAASSTVVSLGRRIAYHQEAEASPRLRRGAAISLTTIGGDRPLGTPALAFPPIPDHWHAQPREFAQPLTEFNLALPNHDQARRGRRRCFPILGGQHGISQALGQGLEPGAGLRPRLTVHSPAFALHSSARASSAVSGSSRAPGSPPGPVTISRMSGSPGPGPYQTPARDTTARRSRIEEGFLAGRCLSGTRGRSTSRSPQLSRRARSAGSLTTSRAYPSAGRPPHGCACRSECP